RRAALEIRAREARQRKRRRVGARPDSLCIDWKLMDPQASAGLAGFLAQTDAVGKSILAILLVMSIATWYLIATKAITVYLEPRRSARFLDAFWDAPSMQPLEKHLGANHPDDPFSHLAWHAVSAHRQQDSEFLTRAMRRVIDEDTARLESGLTVL